MSGQQGRFSQPPGPVVVEVRPWRSAEPGWMGVFGAVARCGYWPSGCCFLAIRLVCLDHPASVSKPNVTTSLSLFAITLTQVSMAGKPG